MTSVLVPAERLTRWVENFAARHGDPTFGLSGGALTGSAPDGSTFVGMPPFGGALTEPTVEALVVACEPPLDWGVLLVRKGGFAVARLAGARTVESKVGQRHVQGRTKAGGQSQQRFARRRDNQARAAYEAAADHAVRIVASVPVLVVGGDRAAVAAVLDDPRLASARRRVVGDLLAVPDPRRAVLEAAIVDALCVRIDVANA